MTAPNMVSIIAGVLGEHQAQHKRAGDGYQTPREHWVDCSCGITVWTWQQFYEENPDDPDEVFAAHQARAVLAAISEAGAVEWGALTLGRKVPYRYAKEVDARNSAKANRGGELVSRLTFPWERAE